MLRTQSLSETSLLFAREGPLSLPAKSLLLTSGRHPDGFGPHPHSGSLNRDESDDIERATTDPELLSAAIAALNSITRPNPKFDLLAILSEVRQTAFEWDIENDQMTWLENAPSALGVKDHAAIATGALYHQLIEPEHLLRRSNAILRNSSGPNPDGHTYSIHYRIRPHGSRTSETLWLQERGICWPGNDGRTTIARGTVSVIDESHVEDIGQHYYSDRDELTGLLNRMRLIEALEASMGRAERKRSPCAFLLVAISNLNEINESFGFDVGDEALTAVGSLIRENLRGGDKIGRYSSNKFGVVLNDCGQDDMLQATDRILKTIHAHKFYTSKCQLVATLSVGGVILPDQATVSGAAISYALHALDQARKKRPNTFVPFEPGSDCEHSRQKNISIADEIVSALENDRMRLVLQPMIDSQSGEPFYHESLLRMVGQDGRYVSAGKFIPVAEQLGLVSQVDKKALELSAQLLKKHKDLKLSVNVSSLTTNNSGWAEKLKDLILGSPHTAERLIIEITETAAIVDLNQTVEFVEMLKELGCKVAIDDFGAGYTSFRNLRNLKVDMVKIDGSFVENIAKNEEDRAFIKTLVELANSLGAQTVAEWVTDQESAKILNEVGVTYLQGFHYGRPFFAEEYRHNAQNS